MNTTHIKAADRGARFYPPITRERLLAVGLEPPASCRAAVGFRAIIEGAEYSLIPGLIGFHQRDEDLLRWSQTVMTRHINTLVRQHKAVLFKTSDVFTFDEDQCHCAVSGNASYGYLYAAFWRE